MELHVLHGVYRLCKFLSQKDRKLGVLYYKRLKSHFQKLKSLFAPRAYLFNKKCSAIPHYTLVRALHAGNACSTMSVLLACGACKAKKLY
jgi:hypothetical protein